MRKLLVSVSFLFAFSCTGKLGNKIKELEYLCGEGADTTKSYILMTVGDKSTSDVVLPMSKDLTVTKKGCVERPNNGEAFVTNTARTLGAWINASSAKSVELNTILPSNFPQTCSSIIHSDGSGFKLSLDVPDSGITKGLQSVEVKLFNEAGTQGLFTWPKKELASRMEFEFSEAKPFIAGNYRLVSEIKDELTNASTISQCILRIDDSQLIIKPAESLKNRRIFNEQEIYVVQPDYSVSFYVAEGFRDVSITYCLKKIDGSDVKAVMDSELLDCEIPKDYSSSLGEKLQDGLWLLSYQSTRGHVTTHWQHSVILVENECLADEIPAVKASGKKCTSIKGHLYLGIDDSEDYSWMEYIGIVQGNLDIFGTFNEQALFPNLNQIMGDLKASLTAPKFYGFPSLEFVWGDILLDDITMEWIDGFQNLKMVTGRFAIYPRLRLKHLPHFKRLTSVRHDGTPLNPAIDNLNLLCHKQRARRLHEEESFQGRTDYQGHQAA